MDKDAAVARLYGEAFQAAGMRAILERDGGAAVDWVRSGNVDFVLLDVALGQDNGFEIADNIRKLPVGRALPLVFVSGVFKAARHLADAREQFGAIDFLEKPVAVGELVLRVQQILGPEVFAPSAPTPVQMSAPPAARGDLAVRPFHQVLCEFVRLRQTGQLAVRREKVKKIIALRDGELAGVKSNLLAECLGRVLVGTGTITEAQCAASLERMKQTGKQQGRTLIEQGVLDERGLDDALTLQLETKLFDVFGWEGGEWTFTARAADEIPLAIAVRPAARLIADGLAHTFEDRTLEALLGDLEGLAPRAGPVAQQIFTPNDASDGAAQVVAASDGSHLVAELVGAHTLSRRRTLALFLALRELGLATFGPAEPREAAPIPLGRPVPPPVPLGPLVDPGDPRAEAKLTRRAEELDRATHYEVLGVPRAASPGEIRRAYVTLAREHHPDKHFQAAPPPLRALAERIFSRVTQAHEVLSDAAERGRYDGAHPEGPSDRFERVLRSDEAFRAGRAAFDGGRYEEAASSLREARDLYPEEVLFSVWLALAEWQARPDVPGAADRALAAFDAARAIAPRLREAHLFASHVRRVVGEAPAGPHDTPARGTPLAGRG